MRAQYGALQFHHVPQRCQVCPSKGSGKVKVFSHEDNRDAFLLQHLQSPKHFPWAVAQSVDCGNDKRVAFTKKLVSLQKLRPLENADRSARRFLYEPVIGFTDITNLEESALIISAAGEDISDSRHQTAPSAEGRKTAPPAMRSSTHSSTAKESQPTALRPS